jgi:hypothetical protein
LALVICRRDSSARLAISDLASLGPLDCGILKEELRLGIMIGSSSDDPDEKDSYSSCTDGGRLLTIDFGMTTVSVLAFPLASIVNMTSVRSLGIGDSGIAVRLPVRGCLIGEERPVRGGIRPTL